jgi:hypothetical protein
VYDSLQATTAELQSILTAAAGPQPVQDCPVCAVGTELRRIQHYTPGCTAFPLTTPPRIAQQHGAQAERFEKAMSDAPPQQQTHAYQQVLHHRLQKHEPAEHARQQENTHRCRWNVYIPAGSRKDQFPGHAMSAAPALTSILRPS